MSRTSSSVQVWGIGPYADCDEETQKAGRDVAELYAKQEGKVIIGEPVDIWDAKLERYAWTWRMDYAE